MNGIALKSVTFGGLSILIPEIWNATTESYTEPDGRECAMIEISAAEGDPICEYDFLGTTAFGFDVPTEDQMACNFMCAEVGFPAQLESGVGCRLFTILTTAQSYEDIDDLLDLIEESIYFK